MRSVLGGIPLPGGCSLYPARALIYLLGAFEFFHLFECTIIDVMEREIHFSLGFACNPHSGVKGVLLVELRIFGRSI